MGMDNLLQIAASAGNRSTARRAEKKSNTAKTSTWRLHWLDALQEYYPEAVVSYTTTDAANLKRAVTRGIPQEDVGLMLAWSVKNWEALRRRASFGKKPTGPEIPDMKFLIWAINHAHAGYVAERDGATLDLSKRRESIRDTEAPPAAGKPLRLLPPPKQAAPVPRAIPRTPKPIDPGTIEATRQRLGLPAWGKGK